jgi:hypothetical protein
MNIPLPKALTYLVLITTCVSGGGYLAIQKAFRPAKEINPSGYLSSIIQTGPEREALKTEYLAELLHLSQDHPVLARTFDLKQAREKLVHSPVIKDAEIKLLKSQTLYISYTVRQPIAQLYDVENGALDEEGFLFPLKPFFPPKTLPEIYLGLSTSKLAWNQKIENPKISLALSLLHLLQSPPYNHAFNTKRIDVSYALEESFGKREIVVVLEEGKKQVHLRLNPKNTIEELGNYLELRQELLQKKTTIPLVVDLRIPKLAFMTEK